MRYSRQGRASQAVLPFFLTLPGGSKAFFARVVKEIAWICRRRGADGTANVESDHKAEGYRGVPFAQMLDIKRP